MCYVLRFSIHHDVDNHYGVVVMINELREQGLESHPWLARNLKFILAQVVPGPVQPYSAESSFIRDYTTLTIFNTGNLKQKSQIPHCASLVGKTLYSHHQYCLNYNGFRLNYNGFCLKYNGFRQNYNRFRLNNSAYRLVTYA